ncbi:SpaH/EbpB family LPXTG-anchored major pilin [Leucobacter chinensis]|uniref:SpaH/EbpB family LPXTG-anchored major pilin n=1 Tax=Leucobacter chinensis TaxID=2851010 RepID=UPI001C21C276
MKKTQSRWFSVTALAGAAALTLGSTALFAGPAMAAPGEGGNGTLTVHKLEQPDSGNYGPNDGSEIDTSGAKPLVAGFTACTIDEIDLSVSGDWNRLSNITVTLDSNGTPIATENGTALTLNCGSEQMTAAADGTTVFDLAADKAYVVYESTPAANAVPAAAPTLITIPYPGSGASGEPVWNYNPHIYPKNSIIGSGATKDGKIIGDKVTFDITVPVKELANDDVYDEFRINDQLASFLKYTAGSVKLKNASGTDVALTSGTDYTLTSPSGNGGDEVVLTFLTPGLEKLDAAIGGTVVLTINADAIGTGTTANEAQITVNGKSTDPGTGPEVIDPEEFFADAHIMKEAKNKGTSTNVPLQGAGFDIYTAAKNATTCPATPDSAAVKVVEGDVSSADGTTTKRVLAEGKYCVYETAVPAGYKGLAGGMLFEVADEDASVTVVNTQIGSDEGDLPALPITGAAGSVLLIAGGAALLLIAGVLVAARRKQQQQQL